MGFNAEEHHYEDPFAPVPKGNYECDVEAVEVKPTKAGDDRYRFTLSIVGPAHAGRKLWVAFIPYHAANPDFAAKECGRLSELSRAVGIIRWNSPTELCGRRCTARVRISREDEDQNDVVGFVVPKLAQGVPVSNPPRDAMRAAQAPPPRTSTPSFGGAATVPTNRAPPAPAPRREPPPPVADMPGCFDDDVPF